MDDFEKQLSQNKEKAQQKKRTTNIVLIVIGILVVGVGVWALMRKPKPVVPPIIEPPIIEPPVVDNTDPVYGFEKLFEPIAYNQLFFFDASGGTVIEDNGMVKAIDKQGNATNVVETSKVNMFNYKYDNGHRYPTFILKDLESQYTVTFNEDGTPKVLEEPLYGGDYYAGTQIYGVENGVLYRYEYSVDSLVEGVIRTEINIDYIIEYERSNLIPIHQIVATEGQAYQEDSQALTFESITVGDKVAVALLQAGTPIDVSKLDFKYDIVTTPRHDFQADNKAIGVIENGKLGYINTQGETVVATEFELPNGYEIVVNQIMKFNCDSTPIRKFTCFDGFPEIDARFKNYRKVAEPDVTLSTNLSFQTPFMIVGKAGKTHLIDRMGNVSKQGFDKLYLHDNYILEFSDSTYTVHKVTVK
ncbi:hypothetical protein [Erysipelothrix aquatica]|uniref:hypothetical protein n=1 Tax=Erysipelothrix aquatica TaxID=2683714 RepID=UPI0013596370|nr:hypothetical protein [Erysipelothrix aquatica]